MQEQEGRNIEESSTRVLRDENAIDDVTNVVNINIEEYDVGNMIRAFFDGANNNEEPNEPTKEEKLLREQSTIMLFPGSTTSRLSACLLILDLQASHGWSDTLEWGYHV